MHTVQLIASAIGNEEIPAEIRDSAIPQTCAVTGEHSLCIPRKELLGKSFTNGDLLAAPQSGYISLAAYAALTYKWERCSSWYCDGEQFVRLDRKSVRAMVLAGQYGKQWSGYATTSYKKHGSLFTKVNHSPLEGTGGGNFGKAIWRFEMRDADCTNHARLMAIWDRLDTEIRAGMGRTIMETLDCPPFLIKKFGIKRWLDFQQWARPFYHGALYKFLCYLLPSQEELKFESNTFSN